VNFYLLLVTSLVSSEGRKEKCLNDKVFWVVKAKALEFQLNATAYGRDHGSCSPAVLVGCRKVKFASS
jgi:hypothetical protein